MYTLTWQPPYDWQWMFGFLGARAVEGIETVTERYYERSFTCQRHQGIFRVTPDLNANTLIRGLEKGTGMNTLRTSLRYIIGIIYSYRQHANAPSLCKNVLQYN